MVVDLGLGLHLARWLDDLLLDLDVGVPVGVDDIGLLEQGLGRQDDVSLPRGVGEKLIDHYPEVQRPERLEHPVGVRILGHWVATLDPGHLDGWVLLLG